MQDAIEPLRGPRRGIPNPKKQCQNAELEDLVEKASRKNSARLSG